MSGAGGPRRFYIHAGLPKTGTSYLQSLLFGSREELSRHDVELVPHQRGDHLRLTLAVRDIVADFDTDATRTAHERFAAEVVDLRAGTALLTHESLAPVTPEQGRRLLAPLREHTDYEVHVVVTARDPGRQLPSAWQQRMQARHTFTYEEFLDAVVDRAPLASDLWINQDLRDVLDRWSQVVGNERVHVVTCPPAGAPRDELLRRFCSVLDLDPAWLSTELPVENTSLGQPQAELLRRVNVALGDRFPHSRAGYLRLGQSYLAGRVLQRQKGRPARLPQRLRPWADELAAGWIDYIREQGFTVSGELEDLRPQDASFEDAPTAFADGEILDVAAAALADVLDLRNDELDAWEGDHRRVAELERENARLQELVDSSRLRHTPRRVVAALRARFGGH